MTSIYSKNLNMAERSIRVEISRQEFFQVWATHYPPLLARRSLPCRVEVTYYILHRRMHNPVVPIQSHAIATSNRFMSEADSARSTSTVSLHFASPRLQKCITFRLIFVVASLGCPC
jgi:hypothetical protein